MVIFGATGDLTHRKLLPALYNLALEHPLPPQFTVVGVARRPFSNEEFRQQALDSINQFSRRRPVNPAVWETFSKGLFYHQSQFDDLAGYEALGELLAQLDQERGTRRQPHLLSGDATQFLRRDRRAYSASRSW